MAVMVDQLVELFQGFEMSHLDTERVSFVSEHYLAENKLPTGRRAMSLKGKKTPPETKYFFENARALAAIAEQKRAEVKDQVIAVLFRDSDGTASAGRGLWQHKRDSMYEGFRMEGFEFGVAMIPKPKSEAWLLCATKPDAYQHCDALEESSGNDKAQNALKRQLSDALQGASSADDLKQLIKHKKIDVEQIDMPSFAVFKNDLQDRVAMASSRTIQSS